MSRLIASALAIGAAVLVVAVPLQAAESNAYTVTPLVSDQTPLAGNPADATLVNAWGLTAGLTANGSTPWWVVDNGTNASTLYTGTGAKQALTVGVAGGPTGVVFNAAPPAFQVAGGASLFIFASEAGQVLAWRGGLASAQVVSSAPDGAIYKGLAFATTAGGPRLYATDFHNGKVDVFDSSWTKLVQPGAFVDPSLPAGYAPFGIQSAGGRIFVTYAQQGPEATDEVAGQGRGFVDVYDTSGALLARVGQHGQLNAPWGIAVAPASFGRFGGDVLVGNFGDGQINAYEEQANGRFEHRGELHASGGGTLSIDGLWALQFGLGGRSGPADTLFFTAGPDDESHGLFGSITAG